MILVDANILIYAHVSSFAQHDVARQWLDRQLNGSTPIGLPWASVLTFLRLVTNPRVLEHPEPIIDAWLQVRTIATMLSRSDAQVVEAYAAECEAEATRSSSSKER